MPIPFHIPRCLSSTVTVGIALTFLAVLPSPHSAAHAAESAAPAPHEYASSEQHYAALKARAHGGTRMTWDKLPDWSGVWESAQKATFDGKTSAFSAKPFSAPLKPEFAAQYAKVLADARNGILYDRLTECFPAGFPRMQTELFFKEFAVTPDRVWMINEMVNEIRRIYIDGRGHLPDEEAYPLWEGDSIGFWDHDSLIVHTTNLRSDPKGYQGNGAPQSEQITTVEVIRKVDANTIMDDMTVYDPEVLEHPWHVQQKIIRVTSQGARLDQWVCEENNAATRSADGGTSLILPGEKVPSQPKPIIVK
jgi:hypothetical protein